MKSIKLDTLAPGTTTDTDYYSENGDILLGKGVKITQNHIDVLKRRNTLELYIKLSDTDEINNILEREFESLSNIEDLELTDIYNDIQNLDAELNHKAKALELPEFKDIPRGEEGYNQLINSLSILKIDDSITPTNTQIQPSGKALKDFAEEMKPSDRTDTYKEKIVSSYNEALRKVKIILNAIADGEKIDGTVIRKIVEEFVNIFISDKNILLNLSLSNCKDTIYIYNHALNVSLLTINIAAALGYSKNQVVEIGIGSLLFDVGMLLIPKHIYMKEGKLTKSEQYEVQKHPVLGLHLLERIPNLPKSTPLIAYQSHERENTKGYPKKRGKLLINNYAKIVQIADIFVALISTRPYREALMPYKAMEILIKLTKEGLISGEYVKAFLTYASLFPVGSLVEINDKRIGKIINANGNSFAKPVISILTDTEGRLLPKDKIIQIDLSLDTDIHVLRALKLGYLKDITIMDGF